MKLFWYGCLTAGFIMLTIEWALFVRETKAARRRSQALAESFEKAQGVK